MIPFRPAIPVAVSLLFAALSAPLPLLAAEPFAAGHPLADADLARVSAKGLPDASGVAARNTLRKVTSALDRQLSFLSMDTSMTDVVGEPASVKSILNPDGSITETMPSTIGEVHFEHVRIKGSEPAHSFGSLTLRNVDLRGSSLTLAARP